MEHITTIAIGKVIKAAALKKASASLTVGEHQIDEMVHIKGVITKAKDEKVAPTCSLALLETLALTLHYAGVTRSAALTAIRKAATESLKDDSKTKGKLLEEYDWMEKEIATIKKGVISKLPKIPKLGKVTTKLDIEEVTLSTGQEKDTAEQVEETVTTVFISS